MKTDLQLQQDVSAELRWDPAVHAAQIGVRAHDGVVTLTGEVGSHAEQWAAEVAARRVVGVRALVADMSVKRSALGLRTDADIAASAYHAISWTHGVPASAIQVMVDDGWVTLLGTVSWQFQREAAAAAVRGLWGVTGLSNQIHVDPAPGGLPVREDIEAAIHRLALGEHVHPQVDVQGADVTLTGAVPGWAERDLVMRSVWSSPGVRRVVDHLVLR